MLSSADKRWLKRACVVANSGTGTTYPNPCVGAVIVSPDGDFVAEGHSAATGGDHAEVRAISAAGARCAGATMYVSLEPCAHHGRTPPCCSAIVAAGIRRVVVATVDPAPHVNGQGLEKLRAAGVEVEVAEDAAFQGARGPGVEPVHAHYLHHVRTGMPWVTLKLATSIDAKIACHNGESRWITGPQARRRGHQLRAEHHAIAVARGTLEADDPALTCRDWPGCDPLPVVFDSSLRAFSGQLGAGKVPRAHREGAVWLHSQSAPEDARARCRDAGGHCIEVASGEGGLDVVQALRQLGELEIRSLLVEGGGRLVSSFLRAGSWQRLWHFSAPVLLGEGLPAFSGFAPDAVADAPKLRCLGRELLGDDVLSVYAPVRG